MKTIGWALAIVAIAGISGVAGAADAIEGDVYTLGTCPISGKALGPKAVKKAYEGRDVRFCCGGCPAAFEKDLEASLAKLDAKMIEDQDAHYPLDICVVNKDHKLGDDAISKVYNNRLVKFCCKGCVEKFEADKAAFVKEIDEAVIAKQEKAYPLKGCIVSDEPLGSMGDPINYVVGNRLVKFCCKSCKGAFDNDPTKFLAKLDK